MLLNKMSRKKDTAKAHEKSPPCTNCFSTGNLALQIDRLFTCKMQQLVALAIARSKCRTSIYNHGTDPHPFSYVPGDKQHHKNKHRNKKKGGNAQRVQGPAWVRGGVQLCTEKSILA